MSEIDEQAENFGTLEQAASYLLRSSRAGVYNCLCGESSKNPGEFAHHVGVEHLHNFVAVETLAHAALYITKVSNKNYKCMACNEVLDNQYSNMMLNHLRGCLKKKSNGDGNHAARARFYQALFPPRKFIERFPPNPKNHAKYCYLKHECPCDEK